MSAAAILREARSRARLSQRELASRARTSQARISRIENGREEPSYGTLERLVLACGFELAHRLKRPSLRAPDLDLQAAAARVARAAELSRVVTSIAVAAKRQR
jgi:transcriptional regulator with XRE-family HTH domain